MTAPVLARGPADGTRLVLAHGAGAPMDSPFMEAFASGLAAEGIHVLRFEFPYMAERRTTGRRRPPDREAVLLQCWRDVVASVGRPSELVIGGKSMGGRMASMIADEFGVAGLVCLGYPFHAPGRPGSPRIGHLESLGTPAIIVQGTRDPFGKPEEVAGYRLASSIAVHWVKDGDHDLVPRASSGRTAAENWAEGVAAVAGFVRGLQTGR